LVKSISYFRRKQSEEIEIQNVKSEKIKQHTLKVLKCKRGAERIMNITIILQEQGIWLVEFQKKMD